MENGSKHMQRRTFLKNTAKLALGLGIGVSLGFRTINNWYDDNYLLPENELAEVGQSLEKDFNELVAWLDRHGWTKYLAVELGIELNKSDSERREMLVKKLNTGKLDALRKKHKSGYDDFEGDRLIQPGFPAHSLLYHTIASPRVKPPAVTAYPELWQIDLLENYIYALCKWEQLKSIYGINEDRELVMAVFAYEYRPAFKTPHHTYADMVYSRTGIARVGDEPLNYDGSNRCFTNKPANATRDKNVAVTPARYGLFIARKVSNTNISLLTTGRHKGADSKDDRNDRAKTFLLPVRKIFKDDLLVPGMPTFIEEHTSIKLQKLASIEGVEIRDGLKPTARNSNDLIDQDNTRRHAGSSFLVIPKPEKLIRPAKEHGRSLFIKVPQEKNIDFENRFFTAMATQKVEDVELLEGNDDLGRVYSKYAAPRNQPMFVNITNEAYDSTGVEFRPIPKGDNTTFEDKVNNGGYFAPLFEDSLCDGYVSVSTTAFDMKKLNGIDSSCLPAFSIVTAPDFFPQVDPLDFVDYDIAPGFDNNSSNFYEGGTASLATARIRPNPRMIRPDTNNPGDTYLAVLSPSLKNTAGYSDEAVARYKDPIADRGYEISSYLPDVASSVFAPGWDVTYCSLDNIHDIFIGTEGLGSPFIEDMKFCSALNGMWPATSPDAARTYQGGLEPKYRNPTAVPLLDTEIGICAEGPAGKAYACTGWDGEQGPYLEKKDGKWKINFTDIGRADAISNALNGTIDMSKLRKLKSNELIKRMKCLKLCIEHLPGKNFNTELYTKQIVGYTYLWLVSAEKVNWGVENALGLGIPVQLAGDNKRWLCDKKNARVSGEGYLYVFVNSAPDEEYSAHAKPKEWTSNPKRRRLDCEQIFICQVTPDKMSWTEVKNGSIRWTDV